MNCDVTITDIRTYPLRRAYTQGRDRAYELSRQDRSHIELCGMEVFNPYAAEPERSRWNEGFARVVLP